MAEVMVKETMVKDEVELVLAPTESEAAAMLVKTYVPEYDPDIMTFAEALDEAILRDAQAASEFEASVKAALASADEGDDAELAAIANTLLGDAEQADRAEREAEGAMEGVRRL